jgi:succinate dehydrogenase / fumarate reductase iron-sulfur subunit
MPKIIELRIKRRLNPETKPYWEEFSISYQPNMNVISALMEIQRNPVNKNGQATPPVTWDCACLEEVCGACTMIVNGKVRQSCTALVDRLEQPIRLEPMTKFPVIRDLQVDRSRMFEALKRVKAWIPIDGTYDLGPGPRMSQKDQEEAYILSRCMSCGCCLEVCPQVNPRSEFIGPAIISQVRLFNTHPTGELNKHERLEALMGPGGIADCGNAQACYQACPKEIPLTKSIVEIQKEMTKTWFEKILVG